MGPRSWPPPDIWTRGMEIKLDEKERGWAIANLDDILEYTKTLPIHEYPFGPRHVEFLEHFIAILSNGKCEGCGHDFSK